MNCISCNSPAPAHELVDQRCNKCNYARYLSLLEPQLQPVTKDRALLQKQQLAKLRELENMWDDLARKILEEAGWLYSSQYPDSCWRYCKTFNKGGQITCDAHEAIRIEETLNNRAIEAIGFGEEPDQE